jgi:3-hydroxybutyryl-CoA dehydrogenase
MKIKKIFVVGAGLMGSGITQVCAQAGYSVVMEDMTDDVLKKGLDAIRWSVNKFVEKGKVKGTVDEVMRRIAPSIDLADAGDADFVFEAVFEDLKVKHEVFSKLDEICPSHTILATNTSAIPITEIAAATKRAERVIGTHFFSPVPMMPVVEVIRGLRTSDETMQATKELCQSIGREPVTCNKDVAGFLFTRFNAAGNIEIIKLVEQGVGTVEEIDKGVRLGLGRAMGPFETGDLTGLDVSLNAYMNIYNETKDPKFFPPMLLRRKVKAGHLGKKVGIGWYRYDDKGNRLGPA